MKKTTMMLICAALTAGCSAVADEDPSGYYLRQAGSAVAAVAICDPDGRDHEFRVAMSRVWGANRNAAMALTGLDRERVGYMTQAEALPVMMHVTEHGIRAEFCLNARLVAAATD